MNKDDTHRKQSALEAACVYLHINTISKKITWTRIHDWQIKKEQYKKSQTNTFFGTECINSQMKCCNPVKYPSLSQE